MAEAARLSAEAAEKLRNFPLTSSHKTFRIEEMLERTQHAIDEAYYRAECATHRSTALILMGMVEMLKTSEGKFDRPTETE